LSNDGIHDLSNDGIHDASACPGLAALGPLRRRVSAGAGGAAPGRA
jgi:hypothetical protein